MSLEPTPRPNLGEFQPRSLKELFDFLKTVPAEQLVKDRRGLAKLHKGVGDFYYRKEDLMPIRRDACDEEKAARESYIKSHEINPYPVLIFKEPGLSMYSLEHEAFELTDPNFAMIAGALNSEFGNNRTPVSVRGMNQRLKKGNGST